MEVFDGFTFYQFKAGTKERGGRYRDGERIGDVTTTDVQTAQRWVDNGANVGVGCGEDRNGYMLVCVDVDTPEAHQQVQELVLPETYTEQTPRGFHYWYLVSSETPLQDYKDKNTKLEIKARNPVLIAPSIVAGNSYLVVDNTAIAEAPEWVIGLCRYRESRVSKYGSLRQGLYTRNDVETAKRVLSSFDPDDYDDWVKVGIALHHTFGGDDAGFEIWDNWSKKSPKYTAEEMSAKWRSFTSRRGRKMTLGTLVKNAHERNPNQPIDQPTNQPTEDGVVAEDTQQKITPRVLTGYLTSNHDIEYNDLLDRIEIDGVSVDDYRLSSIYMQLADSLGWVPESRVWNAIRALAYENTYNPITRYFDGLPQTDSTQNVQRLLNCLEISESEDPGIVRGVVLKWLVGIVAKVFEQRQNLCLVLEGEGGIGKSSLLRWLSPNPAWYTAEQVNPEDKDSLLRTTQYLLIELEELAGITRKRDVDAVKSFLTRETVTVRAAYHKTSQSRPQTATFGGSVNEDTYLVDNTGNRRFFGVALTGINWDYTNIDKDSLWSELVSLYRSGMDTTLSQEETAYQRGANNQRLSTGMLGDVVQVLINPKEGSFLPVFELRKALLEQGINITERDRGVKAAMVKLGYVQGSKKINGKVSKGYVDCELSYTAMSELTGY